MTDPSFNRKLVQARKICQEAVNSFKFAIRLTLVGLIPASDAGTACAGRAE